ncbi:MAG: sulfatase-like hydrolase/transferase, partial [Candidatus Hydrogenedentes bacterium]|nr:sulfatase-like hydrolase/transferase [Candidatus Hydrogenedentota bacterium]
TPSTPALDHLVGEGVCLTQHYSASAVCAPARAALLTGRYPHRTGAIDTLEGRGSDRLALHEVTLADALKNAGYATGLIGKWHNGALDPRYHPNKRGFDEFAGFCGGWQNYYQWRLDYNGGMRHADGRYLTDVFAEEAANFIRRHHAEPFFLMVTFNAPHFPLQVPEEESAPFEELGRFTRAVSAIYGMIARMDKGVTRIIESLEDYGLTNDTLVMFTSDNGPQFGGEGEACTTRYNSSFNGCKGNVYEGGIRVPMVLRWPGGLSQGGRCNAFVHFCDWFPTLLALAGARSRGSLPLDGVDILPVLRAEQTPDRARRFWQWNRYRPVKTCDAAMRDGDWKLVRPSIAEAMTLTDADCEVDHALKYEPDRFDGLAGIPEPERTIPAPPPPQLFKIDEDPFEREDRAAEEPKRTERMLDELDAWFDEVEGERQRLAESWT